MTKAEKDAAKAKKQAEKDAAKAPKSAESQVGATAPVQTEQNPQGENVTPSGIVVPGSVVAETPAPTPVASKGDAIVEFMHQGKLTTRVYTEEIHGEDYKELAKGFAEKKANLGLKGKFYLK
jgi:hypothetical protein